MFRNAAAPTLLTLPTCLILPTFALPGLKPPSLTYLTYLTYIIYLRSLAYLTFLCPISTAFILHTLPALPVFHRTPTLTSSLDLLVAHALHVFTYPQTSYGPHRNVTPRARIYVTLR